MNKREIEVKLELLFYDSLCESVLETAKEFRNENMRFD